ncbi:serine hydrolase family protein [Candidatus Woesearchaeota archaeon]|nr:serine hydrolase family protein [Candidatus Woesearchaeota archaeon]
MVSVIIVHGAYGSPSENWFPWLAGELRDAGCEVHVPAFPTPEGQDLDAWLAVMDAHPIDDGTILIGHSLGVPFLLHLLETRRCGAAFCVAGFASSLGNERFDSVNASFLRSFDWDAIRRNCRSFTLFHSDNDPYVPLTKAQELARHLSVRLTIVKGAGHFNERAGYTAFPQLLAAIREKL